MSSLLIMSEKAELKSFIIDRTKNITNDNRTFLWLRSNYKEDLDNSNLNIGGGNLSIALSCFAVLEYLSKIHYGLIGDIDKCIGITKRKANFITNPDVCFATLIRDSNCGKPIGIEELQYKEMLMFWNEWRNKLAHLLCQNEAHSSISFLSTKDKYMDFIKGKIHTDPAFERKKDGKNWNCLVDTLNRDLDIQAEWVASDVLDSAKQKNIKRINLWLKSELNRDFNI